MDLKKVTQLSVLLALSIVLNIVESFFPIFVPGLKIGIANVVVLFILYKFSFKDALFISILKVIVVGILRTGLFSMAFFFGLFGAIFSVVFMFLFKRFFSVVGVSIIGAVFHNFGQILVAVFFLKNWDLLLYFPYLILFSIPMGMVVGFICKRVIEEYDSVL